MTEEAICEWIEGDDWQWEGGWSKVQPLIRCKNCSHRPQERQGRIEPPRQNIEYENGEPWLWDDDMTCPYLCGDSYYNRMPEDEQYCDRAERREE